MSDDKNFYHIDENSNTAIILGDVNEEMHKQFFEVLSQLDAPVIFFASPGGDVESALGIYDLISGTDTKIVVNGLCASAGTLIIQAARTRLATPSSQFLVHFGEESANGEAERKHNRTVERYWLQLFQSRTKASMRKVRKWHAGETYFNVQQALKEGLIDGINTNTDSIVPASIEEREEEGLSPLAEDESSPS